LDCSKEDGPTGEDVDPTAHRGGPDSLPDRHCYPNNTPTVTQTTLTLYPTKHYMRLRSLRPERHLNETLWWRHPPCERQCETPFRRDARHDRDGDRRGPRGCRALQITERPLPSSGTDLCPRNDSPNALRAGSSNDAAFRVDQSTLGCFPVFYDGHTFDFRPPPIRFQERPW
jgi:hypothetical protein